MLLGISITEFNEKFYILEIKKIVFPFPYLHILGTHHCSKEHHEAIKRWRSLQYFLYHHDYKEHVVANFYHQIQYEYYGENISISIEGIALKHFSTTHHNIPLLVSGHLSRHSGFQSFLLTKSDMILPLKIHTLNELWNC